MGTTNTTPVSQLLNSAANSTANAASVQTAISSSVSKNAGAVTSLHQELTANNGTVPAAWQPYLGAFQLLCEAVELFAGPELKAIITVVLAAISAAEGL